MKNYAEVEVKMKNNIEKLEHELTTVRAGRANPAVLEKVSAEYYGAMTPISQMAAISIPEARTLVIQPWDVSSLKAIEKAIFASDIGITPNNDGKAIRLSFPAPTEEKRRELVKQINKYGEETKVSVRNVRRDAIEMFKSMKKKSELTEDDVKEAEKEVQDYTDKYCKEIDAVVAKKEKEIMEI